MKYFKIAVFVFFLGWAMMVKDAMALYGIDDKYDPYKEFPRISMDFKNAELVDVLKALSKQSGMNFVASSDLQAKKINLYLDNVAVDEALNKILAANGLTYELDEMSNIFIVKQAVDLAPNLMTRVYYLKYASVPASTINTPFEDEESSGASSSEEDDEEEDSGILGAVNAVLSERGKVVEDERTNSLIVTDVPGQFPLIEQTIARLDIKTPQVLIEVEMMDISKSDSDKLGVKFSESPMSLSTVGEATVYSFSKPSTVADNFLVGTLSFEGLSAVMQFLKSQSDAKSLARPRIFTLNNQTAEIEITTSEAVSLNTTTSSATSSSVTTIEPERVDTGVFLQVTPQVNLSSKEITMAVQPRVTEAKQGATFNTPSGAQSVKDPETRSTRTVLRVKDGDTVVIGGLMRNEDTNIRSQVPLLHKVPVLGAAFRSKDLTARQRELIVFITPHIVEDGGVAGASSPTSVSAGTAKIDDDRLRKINKELTLFEKSGDNQ